jgi:hypothetical protein
MRDSHLRQFAFMTAVLKNVIISVGIHSFINDCTALCRALASSSVP